MTLADASQTRKTKQMRRVEAEQGEDIVSLLRRLHYDEGLTVAEIAERIGVPYGTVAAWFIRLGLDRSTLARRAAAEGVA